LTIVGTIVCIAAAFAIDSNSFKTGDWKWGTDPVNDFLIPLLIAPPFFFYLLNEIRQLAIAHHELMTVAMTDSLTSLLNRRAFTELVDGYLKRVAEISTETHGALLVVDVDDFKSINDRFGHDAGDEALRLIAESISMSVHDKDLVGRVGGEEFCVFVPKERPDYIPVIAERIRLTVNDIAFSVEGRRHDITVSVGGVTFDRAAPFADLYRSADERLYHAKNTGRNRVELCSFGLT